MKILKYKIDEVTLVLVIAILAIIFGIYHDKKSEQHIDAKKITEFFMDDHELGFAKGGVIDSGKLEEVEKMSYAQIKEHLGIQKDFCMYLEDDKGKIILAKGSAKLAQDGLACK